MDVVVSGPIPPNPTDLIESDRMHDIIKEAESEYDLVVIDTPPTSVVSDAIPLVKQVSGVIVVCRLGKTTRESATHLRNQLVNLEANTLGVVVNSIGRLGGYYGYGYGYGYGEQDRRSRRRERPGGRSENLPPTEPGRVNDEARNGAQNGGPARDPVGVGEGRRSSAGGQAPGLLRRLNRRRRPPRPGG
jgi:hypothetical protein